MNETAAAAPESEVNLGDVLHEAWRLTDGSKGAYWLAILIAAVLSLLVGGAATLVIVLIFGKNALLGQILIQLVNTGISACASAGLFVMAISRARGQSIRGAMVLDQIKLWWPLFVVTLAISLAVMLGLFLLIIPGIYLAVSYMFAVPLVADKHLGVWEAMETSRQTVSRNWFIYFLWCLAAAAIALVSLCLLGIPLIWTVPMLANSQGVLYRNAFDR